MKHLLRAFLLSIPLLGNAADLNLPLHPAEAKIIQAIAATEGVALLPTINDDFTGTAPDLGALELGQPAPVYGPRWLKPGDIFYR